MAESAAGWDEQEARVLAKSIVETIRQPLILLNEDLTVRFANPAFYEMFRLERRQTEGRPLHEVGHWQWDIPRLRELLSAVLAQRQAVEAFEVEHSFEAIGRRILLFSARALSRAGDLPSLILVTIEDVTERRHSEWLLEHQKELAEKIVDTVREPLLILYQDLRVQSANHAFYETFKVDRSDTEGRMIYDLGNGQWDIPELRRLLVDVLPDNEFFEDFEVEHSFEAIGRRLMLLNARRVDHLQLILLAIEDVTDRRRAEQERELLVGELNHRVKNLFAVVRALVTQSDGVRSATDARQVLLGRLDALARAHDLLFESQWHGADLSSLAGALQQFAADRTEAVEIDGAPIRLNARQALSLSLVLHELATNAAKYGALSVPEGRVRISWQVEATDQGRQLRFTWQESHGPAVIPPQESGFGTELIQRAFGFELDGTADLAFQPEGVRLAATIPLP